MSLRPDFAVWEDVEDSIIRYFVAGRWFAVCNIRVQRIFRGSMHDE